MARHDLSKYVLCPYYKYEERTTIYCEGAVPESAIHLVFPSKEKLRIFRTDHCEQYRSNCPIAHGLNKKWNYEDVV